MTDETMNPGADADAPEVTSDAVSSGQKAERITDRLAMRDKIFSSAKTQSMEVEFFGTVVEMRQPPMDYVMEMQAIEDKARAAAQMIVGYAYVPGTDERVFDEADIDSIAKMPFGGDMSRMNQAITKLTDIDILGQEGNSKETQDSSTSTS